MAGSRERCVYCGSDKDLTVDHVPPKLLLMRPYPSNLITVPACETCNQSFQKDDEYIRALLAVDVRAAKNPAAQSNVPAVLRSLKRPNASAFVEYLAGQASSSSILGQDGSPMAQVFELDKARANRTGERFVRALYFKERGTPVPIDAKIKVGCKMSLRPEDADTILVERVMKGLPDWRDGIVGPAFSYMGAFGEGGSASAWLLRLYDFFFWLGTVDARISTSPQPEAATTVRGN